MTQFAWLDHSDRLLMPSLNAACVLINKTPVCKVSVFYVLKLNFSVVKTNTVFTKHNLVAL